MEINDEIKTKIKSLKVRNLNEISIINLLKSKYKDSNIKKLYEEIEAETSTLSDKDKEDIVNQFTELVKGNTSENDAIKNIATVYDVAESEIEAIVVNSPVYESKKVSISRKSININEGRIKTISFKQK